MDSRFAKTQRHGDTEVAKVRLGDLISEAKPIRCNNRDLPVLSMTMKDGLVLQSEKFKKRVASEDVSNYKVVSSNQLVVSFPIDEGVLAVQQIVEEGIVSPAYAIWNVDEDKVIPKYLESYLRSPSSLHYYKSKLRGTTVRRRSIPKSDFLAMELVLPTLKNQEMALQKLDLITEMIRNREAQLARLDTLVKSKFDEMFGDVIANDRKYRMTLLGDLGNWGSGGTPSRKNREYFQGDIDWYSAGELNDFHLQPSKEKISEEALKNSAAKLWPAGSLLVGMYDTAAFKMGYLERSASSNQACACLIPTKNIEIRWLYYALLAKKDNFLSYRHGCRQRNLSLGQIKEFQIPLPPLALQKEFAAVVEEVDKSKAAIKKTIENLKTLYKARLQEYFA